MIGADVFAKVQKCGGYAPTLSLRGVLGLTLILGRVGAAVHGKASDQGTQ